MFAHEPSLNPPFNFWEEYEKPAFIEGKIIEICQNIVRSGDKSCFQEVFDMLYEYIEENLEKFLPEVDYGNCD